MCKFYVEFHLQSIFDNQKVISKMEETYLVVLYSKLQIKLTILSMNYGTKLIWEEV